MAIEKVVNLKVNDNLQQTEKATQSLRGQLRAAQLEVAEMSEKFGATSQQAIEAAKRAAELSDAIGDAKALTDAFNPDAKFNALSASLSGVAGGYTAVMGATTLLGVQSESLEKQLLAVQSAMALSTGLQQVGESIDSFKQLGTVLKSTAAGQAVLTAAQSAYTFVVGASTTALKALRVALISTGVGALVVGVGMLIANFEKISDWVSNLIEKFGGWRNVLLMVSAPIWAIVKALEAMGVIETEAEEKARKADEAKAKRKAQLAKQLLADQKRIGDYYDFEIAKAEAAGKDVYELEKQKREAILKTAFAYNEATRALIQSGNATSEQIKAWNENQALITKLQQEGKIAEIKREKEKEDAAQKVRDEVAQKAAEARRKAHEEKLARMKKEQEEELAAMRQFQDQLAQARKEQFDSEISATIEKDNYLESLKTLSAEQQLEAEYQRGRAILEAGNATQQERLNFEMDFQSRRDQMRVDAEKLQAERIAEIQQQQLEAQQAFEDAKFNIANQALGLLSQLSGKNKAIAKAALVLEKGLAIAQVVTATSKSLAQQTAGLAAANLAATAAAPLSFGQPFVGINTAMYAKMAAATKISAGISIASILAQTIEGLSGGSSAGGGQTPSIGGGSTGGGNSPQAPQFNVVGQNANNQLAQTIAGQQGQPIRAYVVGQEVSTQQALDRQIRSTATFNS